MSNVIWLLLRVEESCSIDDPEPEIPVGWYPDADSATIACGACNKALMEFSALLNNPACGRPYSELREELAGKLERYDREGKPQDTAKEYVIRPLARGNCGN